MAHSPAGPLHGVRVLDLSRVLAGPYCAGFLADMGADVVKVESPGGDDARHLGPFRDGESIYFAQLNRGKRSVVLDLKQADQRARLLELVAVADVVVENFRPGVTTRLGIDYDAVRSINPRIVYASISGFGQRGPLSARPAYDLVVQAMSGIMAATGPIGGTPTRVGESLGDVVAGVFAGWGICAALFERERTGQGRHVDVSMFDALVALQVTSMSLLTATGKLPGRIGNRHPVSVPFDTYPTADGMVAIAVANDAIWARLCSAMDRAELAADPAYLGDENRTCRLEEITAVVSGWTSARSTADILATADAAGIPAAPIWTLDEALACEHVALRGSVGTFEHPLLGATPFLRYPVEFAEEHDGYGTDRHVTSPSGPLPFVSTPSPALGSTSPEQVLATWQ